MKRKFPAVLFLSCMLLSCPAWAAATPDDDEDRDLIADLGRYEGLPQMSEDDVEDIRTKLNNGRDPDDFEVARAPVAPVESPDQKVTTPAIWNELQAKANQGDAEAYYILGLCYANGRPIPRDLTKAYQRFFIAARKDHRRAMFFTARCLEMKIGINSPEDEKAAAKIIPRYYGFSAMADDADAAYHLGRYLKYTAPGFGEERSTQESVAKYFHQATDKGHAAAQYELALCYRNGEGLPKLRKLSFKILRVSAEQGYGKAQYDLGLRYAAGDFRVPKNPVEAYAWLATAIANGVADDSWALANLTNQLSPPDLDAAKKLAAEYAAKYKSPPPATNPLL